MDMPGEDVALLLLGGVVPEGEGGFEVGLVAAVEAPFGGGISGSAVVIASDEDDLQVLMTVSPGRDCG